jgi:uncharacterized membrane protein YdbT with pleckstrin-like domain
MGSPGDADEQLIELETEEEQIVARSRLHWMIYRWPAFILIYGAVTMILFLGSMSNPAIALVPFLTLVLSMALGVVMLLRRLTTELVLGDRTLQVREGMLSATELSIPLEEIESVRLDQDAMGRYFDFGSLTVGLEGGRKRKYRPVENVGALYAKLEEGVNERLGRKMALGGSAATDWTITSSSESAR